MNIFQCENCKFYYHQDSTECNVCSTRFSNLGPRRIEVYQAAEEPSSLGLPLRTVSAVWFSLAACVPVGFFMFIFGGFFSRGSGGVGTMLLFGALPIVSAALSGFIFGAAILDPWEIDRPSSAIVPGILTAVVAYLIFLAGLSIAVSLSEPNSSFGSLLIAPIIFLVYGFYGTLLVGWLVVLAGTIAGPLLFWFARKESFESLLFGFGRIQRSDFRLISIGLMAGYFALSITLGLAASGTTAH